MALALLKSLLHPSERFIPSVGARLSDHPRLAAATLAALRSVPGGRFRTATHRHVGKPLVSRLRVDLDVPVAGGSRMRVNTGEVTGRMLATSGLWEPHVTAVFRERLRPGDVCLDIGANVGYFTLLAARIVGPGGHVHAFEPEPTNTELLAEHILSNRLENVSVHRVAVGVEGGTAALHQTRPESNPRSWTLVGRPDERTEQEGGAVPPTMVRIAPLTESVPARDRPRIRLVKIDVDGAEVEVLAALSDLVGEGACPDVVVEVHPWIRRNVLEAVVSFARLHRLSMFEVVDEQRADRRTAATHAVLRAVDPEGMLDHPDPLVTLLLTREDDGSASE